MMSMDPAIRTLLLQNVYPVWSDLKQNREHLTKLYGEKTLYGGAMPIKALVEATRRATVGIPSPGWPSDFLNHQTLGKAYTDWVQTVLGRTDTMPFSMRAGTVWEDASIQKKIMTCLFPDPMTYSPPNEEFEATLAVVKSWAVGESDYADTYGLLGINEMLSKLGMDALRVRPRLKPVTRPSLNTTTTSPAPKSERPRLRVT